MSESTIKRNCTLYVGRCLDRHFGGRPSAGTCSVCPWRVPIDPAAAPVEGLPVLPAMSLVDAERIDAALRKPRRPECDRTDDIAEDEVAICLGRHLE